MLRILLSIVVLAFLIYFVDLRALADVLLNIRFDYLFLLFLIAVVMIWLSALKWRVFIRASGHEVGILRLMKLYTIGYFFNTFTPSYIGGDIARSYHLGRFLKSQKDAFSATFLERFTGLLAMSILGISFVILGAEVTAGVEYAIFFVAAGALFLTFIFFSRTGCDYFKSFSLCFVDKFAPSGVGCKVKPLIEKVLGAMDSARGDMRLFSKAMALSLAFHVGTVVNTWLAAKAIGWDDPNFMELFIVVPLVLLVGMVPLTPAGIGIQEGAFLFFLMRIGATEAQGLGVGVLLRAKVMVIALIGGLMWFFLRTKESKLVAAGAKNLEPASPVN